MATCTFPDARRIVIETVAQLRAPIVEDAPLAVAAGRVLAQPVRADRDYPPLARSIRDGFAVRSADSGPRAIIGEVRAGSTFSGVVQPGQCVEIMTGAPMPAGADAVVMVEHTTTKNGHMVTSRTPQPGEFVNPQAAEAHAGDTLLAPGVRLLFPHIALLATCGYTTVPVYRQPRVAILSTGDEVVPVETAPAPNQVRNSNAWALAAQVTQVGGVPTILPVAPDEPEATRTLIRQGLDHDLLLMSGGVSAGKYDYVETVLSGLDARFLFDRVLIQPGQPLVFGVAAGKPFFGLPGNPASTMACFHVFARAAVQLLAGETEAALAMPLLRLTHDFSHKPGLTRFLPARTSPDCTEVTHIPWQGSSDVAAIARGNAFLVADASRTQYRANDLIPVILYA